MTELIRVTQLPIIEESLRAVKRRVDDTVAEAVSLVCTEDTLQVVKTVRADLNKQFADLEDQRKAVKTAVLEPYERFEAVYRECVADAFKHADAVLKQKTADVENDMKSRCEADLRGYFRELCAVYHIDFVPFERVGVKIDMASARQKLPKKLREQINTYIANIAHEIELISKLENTDEIMVEFKRCLNASEAAAVVSERHRHMEAEAKAREAQAEITAREEAAVKRVEAVAPPVEEEPQLRCTFTVYATKPQLRRLREYLKMEGIRYE